ncbi:hypothetical protein P7K49_027205 [Saguinus oedipus]|uniref:Uncharacterized protein n=1 Tax=Saguinus oedipus TaxID=9490 RepID=A0ABQ9UFC2_SAGOE|nr:hypothetical protein P7K49_027205 [Saguinus oedipus]
MPAASLEGGLGSPRGPARPPLTARYQAPRSGSCTPFSPRLSPAWSGTPTAAAAGGSWCRRLGVEYKEACASLALAAATPVCAHSPRSSARAARGGPSSRRAPPPPHPAPPPPVSLKPTQRSRYPVSGGLRLSPSGPLGRFSRPWDPPGPSPHPPPAAPLGPGPSSEALLLANPSRARVGAAAAGREGMRSSSPSESAGGGEEAGGGSAREGRRGMCRSEERRGGRCCSCCWRRWRLGRQPRSRDGEERGRRAGARAGRREQLGSAQAARRRSCRLQARR